MEQKAPEYNPGVPAGLPPPYSPNPPPPVGFQPQPQVVYAQPGVSTTLVTTQPAVAAPVILVAGANCPSCRAGILRNDFTCMGIFLAICCFPIGMLCCFLMMERRCTNCGLTFS